MGWKSWVAGIVLFATLTCSVVAVRSAWRLEADRETERRRAEQAEKNYQAELDRQSKARTDAFREAFEAASTDVRLAMMETDSIQDETSPMVAVIRSRYQNLLEVFSALDEEKFGPVLVDGWVKLSKAGMQTSPMKLIEAMIQSQEGEFNRLDQPGDFAENMFLYVSWRTTNKSSNEDAIQFTQGFIRARQAKRSHEQNMKRKK